MLYMVQLRYSSDQRDSLREYFERHGVTGHAEGLVLRGAWVSKSRHTFVLVEARDEEVVRGVCSTWAQFGDISYMPVIDIDQIM